MLLWPPARVVAAWFPYSVVRRARLPKGPFVAVINHFSLLDPPVAGLALRRPVRFLALDEIWGVNAALDAVLTSFDSIPVARSDRRALGALRAALRHLESGRPIGVFPEGRRVAAWGEVPLKTGAAWLALRASVPAVPVAIWGSQHAMPMDGMRVKRAPIRVVVGTPIDPRPFMERSDPVPALNESIRFALDQELRRLEAAYPDGPAGG
ncbi:MAG: lysophospholipid acyltransferase family protein [bacterium]|nr:lysophospholipid acyltransferase family protein [bacterium]MDE0352645.1 lysophospholipid acyltransferase family protein [bacterium]